MSVGAPLVLGGSDRFRLAALTRSGSVRASLAQRAQTVLLAGDELPNAEIARRTGPQLADGGGLAGPLRVRRDPGTARPATQRGPPTIDEIDVVVATFADHGRPSAHLGVTRTCLPPIASRRTGHRVRDSGPHLAQVEPA